jgi:hypothetical protein
MTYTPPAAGAPAVPQTQSLVSLIVGVMSFFFSFAPFVNLLAFAGGIVAVVFGFRAAKIEPQAPPWMSLVGRISGFVAIAFSIVFGIVWLAVFVLPLLIPLWFATSYNSL